MRKMSIQHIENINITGYKDEYIFDTIFRNKDYFEAVLLREWLDYIPDDSIIFDVGANIGNHSLFWCKHVKNCKIYSFESCNANYKIFNLNIVNNKILNINSNQILVGKSDDNTIIEKSSEEDNINTVSLDEYKNVNKISKINFIRINSKKHTLEVLEGMKEILSNDKPLIWIVITNETSKIVYDTLITYGYNLIDMNNFNLLFSTVDGECIKIDDFKSLNLGNISEKESNYKNDEDERIIMSSNDKERYNEVYTDYIKLEELYNSVVNKNFLLEDTIIELNNLKDNQENILLEILDILNTEETLLFDLNNYVHKLEIKTEYLQSENDQMVGIKRMLTETIIGKIVHKIFVLFKNIMNKR